MSVEIDVKETVIKAPHIADASATAGPSPAPLPDAALWGTVFRFALTFRNVRSPRFQYRMMPRMFTPACMSS